MKQGRDVAMTELLPKQRPYAPCEWMDAEDPLFILYTSGSTGEYDYDYEYDYEYVYDSYIMFIYNCSFVCF